MEFLGAIEPFVFMVYLSFQIVFPLIYNTMRFQFIYIDRVQTVLFSAAVVLTCSLALVLAVVVESPLLNVETAIYKFAGGKRPLY